jgi:hypothetical protein
MAKLSRRKWEKSRATLITSKPTNRRYGTSEVTLRSAHMLYCTRLLKCQNTPIHEIACYIAKPVFKVISVFPKEWFGKWGDMQAAQEMGAVFHSRGARVLRLALPDRPLEKDRRHLPFQSQEGRPIGSCIQSSSACCTSISSVINIGLCRTALVPSFLLRRTSARWKHGCPVQRTQRRQR